MLLPIIQQDGNGWFPSGVTKNQIGVIGVNIFPDRGKGNLVLVSGEFELSELELTE